MEIFLHLYYHSLYNTDIDHRISKISGSITTVLLIDNFTILNTNNCCNLMKLSIYGDIFAIRHHMFDINIANMNAVHDYN